MGAVSVAVNWRLAPAEMAAIVEDARAPVLFYGPEYAATAKEVATRSRARSATGCRSDGLAEWRDPRAAVAADDPGFEPGADDVVTQLYTSGTTGAAQGGDDLRPQRLDHPGRGRPGLPHRARTPSRWWPCPCSTSGAPAGPCGMSRGGHSVIIRDIDPVETLRLIERHRITETFVVPAVLMFLLATPGPGHRRRVAPSVPCSTGPRPSARTCWCGRWPPSAATSPRSTA